MLDEHMIMIWRGWVKGKKSRKRMLSNDNVLI
jgi:hypothetical protein